MPGIKGEPRVRYLRGPGRQDIREGTVTGCGSQTGYSSVTGGAARLPTHSSQRAHRAIRPPQGLCRIRMGAKADRLSASRPKEYESPCRWRKNSMPATQGQAHCSAPNKSSANLLLQPFRSKRLHRLRTELQFLPFSTSQSLYFLITGACAGHPLFLNSSCIHLFTALAKFVKSDKWSVWFALQPD